MKYILAFLLAFTFYVPAFSFSLHELETPDFSHNTTDIYQKNKLLASELLKAVKEKKLIVPDYIRVDIEELSINGYCHLSTNKPLEKVYAAPELLFLIYKLVNAPGITAQKPLSILSLFRYGSSAHGKHHKNDVIGYAIDIDSYAGHKIHMNNPGEALEAIVNIIDNLPSFKYTFGLPRPGGGKLIAPEKDYFLPVVSLSQNERSPTGTLKGDLKLIKNTEARNRITNAVYQNKKAEILFFMPDAVDHLHIKVVTSGKY